ncbi:MAG: nicotinate (nicotinamide) nucleotide adenylyltransferase [Bacteroidota bacterium]
MKIGLFFGSFNPVHIGHLIIANYMAQHTPLEKVWLIVSPHNPLKAKSTLAKDHDRLHLVHLGISDNPFLRASDIEFKLPKPSYTIDTLIYLREKYPQHEFILIMGGDNLVTLPKWKNYEKLLSDYSIYVYNRPNSADSELVDHPSVHFFDAPMMHISSSYIRKQIRAGHSIQYLVPERVYEYLLTSHLYRK